MIEIKHIKTLRALCGMSQAELARKVKVNPATISRLESGKMQPTGPLGVLLKKMYEEAQREHG